MYCIEIPVGRTAAVIVDALLLLLVIFFIAFVGVGAEWAIINSPM